MNGHDRQPKYSVVIPVYNSAPIVGDTVDQAVAFFEEHGYDYEMVVVNDGSRDGSWAVLKEKATANPHIQAIDLLHNYGQHTALLCGLKHTTGDYVITLDDDLQNPPSEIACLTQAAEAGHDVVFGRFRQKQHAAYRRLGSRLIGLLNTKIFHKPAHLVLSNFRIIRRDVVDRVCAYHTAYPYIPGLLLMFSSNPGNVWVEHRSRPVGQSNYNWLKIAELVMRILFNYSSFPLRLASAVGAVVAVISSLLGFSYLIRALVVGFAVPGWATLVVMLAFFNGLLIMMMSMLGEYIVRLLNQSSSAESYHIREAVNRHE
jgi:glycosyltransferase involved in cell wall biosynthesis